MARNTEKPENLKQTLKDLDCGEKTEKRRKCDTQTV
jgi:hypothetical protein